MPRSLSLSFRQQVNAQYSGDVVLAFAEISHPTLGTPIRVVSDAVNYIWGGNTWSGVMFDLQILNDGEGVPTANVTLPNIDTTEGRLLENLVDPPSVRLWLLSSADFNLTVSPRTEIGTASVEYYAEQLFLSDVVVDAVQISARLVTRDYSREFCFNQRATKARTPGVWR